MNLEKQLYVFLYYLGSGNNPCVYSHLTNLDHVIQYYMNEAKYSKNGLGVASVFISPDVYKSVGTLINDGKQRQAWLILDAASVIVYDEEADAI